MKLNEIKTSYNSIISLGAYCQIIHQLERKKLKNFSGPFDWISSPCLSDVNKLLTNKFVSFMEYSNLIVEGSANNITYIVKDNLYNISSYHDFPLVPNNKNPLSLYPIFKKRLDIKVDNFLRICTNSNSLLFIRMGASYEEITNLVSILKDLVKKEFTLLVINLSTNKYIAEHDWGIKNVCTVEIEDTLSTRWEGCDSTWDQLLQGIALRK